MPCFDGRDNCRDNSDYYLKPLRKMEARMCGVLTVLEAKGHLKQTLDQVDWAEAGVSKDGLLEWWDTHKKQDAKRRKEDAKANKAAAEAKAAYDSLTPKQRKALGINPVKLALAARPLHPEAVDQLTDEDDEEPEEDGGDEEDEDLSTLAMYLCFNTSFGYYYAGLKDDGGYRTTENLKKAVALPQVGATAFIAQRNKEKGGKWVAYLAHKRSKT